MNHLSLQENLQVLMPGCNIHLMDHLDDTTEDSTNICRCTSKDQVLSKIYCTGTINSTTTIEKLRCYFAMHSLPNLLVSDNGPCFISLEFAEFTRKNGIKHRVVRPYHQASNGLAENSVKIVKRMSGGTLETKPSWFLLSYMTTPDTTTGVTPAELLMKRKLQTNLDRLKPSLPLSSSAKSSEILSW